MRKLLFIPLAIAIACLHSCGGNGSTALTQEQKDSIAKVQADSTRLADSIAAVKKAEADSTAAILAKEKAEKIVQLAKKFRVKKDEFSDYAWIEHSQTTPYRNSNSVQLCFQKDGSNNARNLRFVVQYEDDDWLFIQNIIFNVDGENITFVPESVERDNGYGGRIWEWSDESASYNSSLVNKIANAKKVKLKLNGRQYYDTRTMSAKQLTAFRETLEYYKALGGSLN
jgi:hypothetical protein